MSCPIHAELSISAFVSGLFPVGMGRAERTKADDPFLALYVRVRLTMERRDPADIDGERSDCRSNYVHLIFERSQSYTKVWTYVSERRESELSAAHFVLQSAHDSCWRTDGLRQVGQTYLNQLRQLRDGGAPHETLHDFNHIDQVTWVKVRWTTPTDRGPERYTLTRVDYP